jgi:hypothetical protein
MRIIESVATYGLAEFERCIIADWRLQPNEREFDRRNVALIELADRFPNACAYIEMIEPTSKPPSAPVRKSAMGVFKSLGPKLSCVATIVLGTEVRVTLVRAVISGMTFFVPKFQPLKVFKLTDDAARWVQEQLDESSEFAQRLTAAADSLRTAPQAQP